MTKVPFSDARLSRKSSGSSHTASHPDSSSSGNSQSASSEMSCSELSSSSSIPQRCENPCEDVCFRPKICEPCPGAYKPWEIHGMLKDAVVTVTATWILIGGEDAGSPVTGTTPLANNSRVEVSIVSNGTLLREKDRDHHDNDCFPMARILVPFHAVFAPPALSSGAVSYPYDTPIDGLGRIRNEYFPASRILVTVNNVNGKGCADYYVGELVGGHGAGDHAYVDISFECVNKHCKVIEKCHPRIRIGNSNKSCVGSKVVMLGNFCSSLSDPRAATSDVSMVTGIVVDNNYLDATGTFLYQALVVSASVYASRSGIPILNRDGRLIGMQTLNVAGVDRGLLNTYLGNGLVGGPTAMSMRSAYHVIMRGARVHESNNQLISVCSSSGQFWIYSPGALLIAARPAVAQDYDVTRDFTSGSPVAGQPRIRLDDSGQFINVPHCHFGGMFVLGLAGLNPNDASGVANGHYYVPGGAAAAPLPIDLPVSPLLAKIKPGDIITHIDGYPVGPLDHQNNPTLILWNHTFTKSSVKITWLKGGNVLNNANNDEKDEKNYTRDCENFRSCVAILPPVLDYPYASVTQFPNVTGALYPSITIPATQTQYPLLPSLVAPGSGIFHPAF